MGEFSKVKHWGLWFFMVLVPAIAVGKSSFDVFPDAKLNVVLMIVSTLGVSLVIHALADTLDPRVRNACVMAVGITCLALVVNWGCHWALNRELSAAKDSRKERNEDADKEQARIKERLELEERLAAARTAETKAATGLISQLPMNRRSRIQLPQAPAGATIQTAPTATPDDGEPVRMKSPDEIRAGWMPLLVIFGFIDLGVTLACGFGMIYIQFYQDSDGDSIPDSAQRVARLISEAAFQKRYPRWYAMHGAMLYPQAAAPKA